MFFVVRSNDRFNFPLGRIKYTVTVIVNPVFATCRFCAGDPGEGPRAAEDRQAEAPPIGEEEQGEHSQSLQLSGACSTSSLLSSFAVPPVCSLSCLPASLAVPSVCSLSCLPASLAVPSVCSLSYLPASLAVSSVCCLPYLTASLAVSSVCCLPYLTASSVRYLSVASPTSRLPLSVAFPTSLLPSLCPLSVCRRKDTNIENTFNFV